MDFTPNVKHDVDTGSFYVELSEGSVYQSKRVTVNVAVDLDEDGEIVGVEVFELGANIPYGVFSAHYNMSDYHVECIKRLLSYKV
jgi:uncharacterized protein YuzE